MDVRIRFGNADDKAYLQTIDKHINLKYIDFKLSNYEILIAERNYKQVGYLRLEYIWTKVPYIGLITVTEEYRRKGVGGKLIQFLEMSLKEQGYEKLYSSSQVNEEEPQKWHRMMGFIESGIINGINEGEIGEIFFVKIL